MTARQMTAEQRFAIAAFGLIFISYPGVQK
jgi:hypothetical protein